MLDWNGLVSGGHGDRVRTGVRTDVGRVVDGSEDQLGRPVVSRADVRHVGLAVQQLFRTAEVAQLEDARALVY